MNRFPAPAAPYYIVSPPFTEKSAGVKVLHMLCHALNVGGKVAYMHSELFLAYEDTFLIMETVLCGCPGVLLPSESFRERHTLASLPPTGREK